MTRILWFGLLPALAGSSGCGGGESAVPAGLAGPMSEVDAALARGDQPAACSGLQRLAQSVSEVLDRGQGRAAVALSQSQEQIFGLAQSCSFQSAEQLRPVWNVLRDRIRSQYGEKKGWGTTFKYVGILIAVMLLWLVIKRARRGAGL